MKMDNFLNFILKDIEAKKTLNSTAPTKTKTNQKKLYETLESIEQKYTDYQANIRNYLIAKSKSLDIKDENPNVERLKERIKELETSRFLLNPFNTYFEKMGFDILLYQINNYYVFNFSSLNDIINGFLDKFEQAGILLQGEDFDYTCYVHEYMTSFLEVYYKKSTNYNKVSEIFEKIYFLNPEIIGHIELNFRKLIEKNKNKFINYISKLQQDIMKKNQIIDYNSCLKELKESYRELNHSKKESISEIIRLAKEGSIDIEQYLEDSKVRKTSFETIISENIDYNNPEDMKDISIALEKLQDNIEEYENYLNFLPLFNDFKEEYKKQIVEEDKKVEGKGLKEIKETISKKEEELSRINRKIFGGKPSFFDFKGLTDSKTLKIESVYKAKELYELYKLYDQEYFKDKIMKILSKTLTISDLLSLYYSFDYFKKLAIKKVYNTKSYDEIVKYSNGFDNFAKNPMNIVMPGVLVFEKVNISRVIANKYHLNNIKITEEALSAENLNNLNNKISLILRINTINNSNTSVEKIWFLVQVEKIITKEEKK